MANILLCICGSVAAIKVGAVISGVKALDPSHQFKVVVTNNAKNFLPYPSSEDIGETLIDDSKEYTWIRKGDPVLHIELRRWADVLVLLPMSANTMAKVCHGICDNLVTAIIRAWEFNEAGEVVKPVVAFPCMNTAMWAHPLTNQQVTQLRQWGWQIFDPIAKSLACGDFGPGALPAVEDVIAAVHQRALASSAAFEKRST